KRFVAVDTLGLLWALLVVPASVQDRVGGITLVERLHGAVKRLKKLWGDSHFDTALREAWCASWWGKSASWSCPNAGSWSGPSVGSTASADCPRIMNARPPAVK